MRSSKRKSRCNKNDKKARKTIKKRKVSRARKAGNHKAISRRRSILRKSSSSSTLPDRKADFHDVDDEVDEVAEHKPTPRSKRGRKVDSKGKGKDANAMESETKPANSGAKPKSTPKAKAVPKAKAKAKAKATAKAKAKASAKAKAKAKAKSKATQSGKASTEKAGKRKKPVAGEGDLFIELDYDRLDTDEQLEAIAKRLYEFASEWATDEGNADLDHFKSRMRDVTPKFRHTLLNAYWTRPACGLTLKASRKDFGSFAFQSKVVPTYVRMAVAIGAAWLLAPRLESRVPITTLNSFGLDFRSFFGLWS